ncbi:hypothetical protein SORBI_3004G109500 [Sorghum bicolor]|uniref:Uncharacterized protein n=1 Tax=Sorghum bicolor TaxID=4558 RepID=A0A194YQ15_SORBI|nr:hypothetical protein SORBI_3004G109500 [Sorghum bicolor]
MFTSLKAGAFWAKGHPVINEPDLGRTHRSLRQQVTPRLGGLPGRRPHRETLFSLLSTVRSSRPRRRRARATGALHAAARLAPCPAPRSPCPEEAHRRGPSPPQCPARQLSPLWPPPAAPRRLAAGAPPPPPRRLAAETH